MGRTCRVGWLMLVMTLGGCGGGEPEQYLTLEIDGKPMDFSFRVNANDPPAEEVVHFVTVGGHLAEEMSSPGYMFQLVGPDIRPGTYSTADSELHSNYYLQTGSGTVSYHGNGSNGTSFTLTIESMTEDGVRGTFSGVLRKPGSGDPGIRVAVTNGRFSARYNGH